MGKNTCIQKSDLLVVHRIGRHHMVPSRAATRGHLPSKGSIKNCVHMLSMGVPLIALNLFAIADKAAVNRFLRETPGFKGKSIRLVITTETLFVRAGKGHHAVYTARGMIQDSQNRECVLQCITMSRTNAHVLLKDQAVTDRTVTDTSGLVSDHMAYSSQKAAKISLAWYIATCLCCPKTWIETSFHPSDWKEIHLPSENNDLHAANSRYVVVTLQNGPTHSCKGASFCTLVLTGNSVFARIERTTTNREPCFLLAYNVNIPRSNPTEQPSTVHNELDKSKRALAEVDAHCGIDCDLEVCPKRPKIDLVPKPEQLPIRKKSPAQSGTLRIPLPVDPFRRSELKNGVYMQQKLAQWSVHWSDRLCFWKSTTVLRRVGFHGDRYWFPPNTINSNVSVKIRSAPDLSSFLNYCVAHANEEYYVPGTTSFDYESLLVQWDASR